MPPAPRASSFISEPSTTAILADHHDRIRHLEAQPVTAHYEIKVKSDSATFSALDNAFVFMVPYDIDTFRLTDAQAFVSVASTTVSPTIQIRKVRAPDTVGVDMLSTPITIDVNEFSSYTALVPRVIDQSSDTDQILTRDLIAIDIDVAGTAQGLGIILVFATS